MMIVSRIYLLPLLHTNGWTLQNVITFSWRQILGNNSIVGWIVVPNKYVPLEQWNGNLFRIKVLTEINKIKESKWNHPGLGWVLNPMKDVLKKDSKGDDRETFFSVIPLWIHSKEGHVKIEEENITLLPQAKEHWEPPELWRPRRILSWSLQGEVALLTPWLQMLACRTVRKKIFPLF